MKKLLLLSLPLLLTACAEVHPYIPSSYGVTVAPQPYYSNKPYYNQPKPQPYYNQPNYNNQYYDDHHHHHDNGKHKGQHKNKHHHD
ncbi:hypothetical protein DOJK_01261 [Patescibacteria group bacterium]|nr:hypothetical protein DOJK_01261 [Patescibacteria group bacterium]